MLCSTCRCASTVNFNMNHGSLTGNYDVYLYQCHGLKRDSTTIVHTMMLPLTMNVGWDKKDISRITLKSMTL